MRKLVTSPNGLDKVVRVKGSDLASLLHSKKVSPNVNYLMIDETQKVPDFVDQLTGKELFTYEPDEVVAEQKGKGIFFTWYFEYLYHE